MENVANNHSFSLNFWETYPHFFCFYLWVEFLAEVCVCIHIDQKSPNNSLMVTYSPSLNFPNFLFALWCWLWAKLSLQFLMELIGLNCTEDLKSKFLACHFLNFYKNHILPSGWIPNLILPYPADSEHVWRYIPLWVVVLQTEACQKYTVFTTAKSSLVSHAPFINLFI